MIEKNGKGFPPHPGGGSIRPMPGQDQSLLYIHLAMYNPASATAMMNTVLTMSDAGMIPLSKNAEYPSQLIFDISSPHSGV
jgi:hypothetical protein